ncbi:MAG: McrC family protein [Planctomycetes bacterium]|nr:McrC family protein [Planctomycetota bacterium]
MNQLVQLVERRTQLVRLPRGDVAFLNEHARHLVEVVPSFRRGRYRITPRGYVGWFDSPTRRFAISPKIPWPNTQMLLGVRHAEVSEIEPDAGLLNVLAWEFASQLRTVTRIGLVAGYHDHDTISPFLRGKFRVAEQLRDAAARAFPDRFHITESVLDLDTPWNRIPRVVADELLTNPKLGEHTRIELQDATLSLGSVPVASITDAEFAAADAEPRASHYRPLLELCRTLHDGFAAARPADTGSGGFLVDMGRTFERWLERGLTAEFARRQNWRVEAQREFPIGPTVLQPDIVIRKREEPRVVLDAKWKAPGAVPDAADLHQILAYAAITGAKHVGLVYPSRRFARRSFRVPGSDITVSLLRVRVIGSVEECRRSVGQLARFVRRDGSEGVENER